MNRLFHRWFIQYNPLYIVSAMLVLGGMILMSRGLVNPIAVAAIAEVYAAVLIGGAALLMRIGQRRPAVMLALLAVLYQGDLTLHTETCAYLGSVGVWATAAWLALFVAKLHALAWAMKLRLSRRMFATVVLGACALAVLPHHLGRATSALVAVWAFALLEGYRIDDVTSTVELDEWGRTVLRRSVRAVGVLWGGLVLFHVFFWSTLRPIDLGALLPVAALVGARKARHVEWFVTATLGLTAMLHPASFAVTALLGAVVLGLRARTSRSISTIVEQPYRASAPGEAVEWITHWRLVTGSLVALYLAIWSAGWTGGPWPDHVLWLDAPMTIALLFVAWKNRVALLPLGAGAVHLTLEARLIPAPHSPVEWGITAVSLGFVLLLASLAVTYRYAAPSK